MSRFLSKTKQPAVFVLAENTSITYFAQVVLASDTAQEQNYTKISKLIFCIIGHFTEITHFSVKTAKNHFSFCATGSIMQP